MREIGNSIAQFLAVIMLLVTLAVSTAAVSQWASMDDAVETSSQQPPLLAANGKYDIHVLRGVETSSQQPPLLASGSVR